MSLESALRAVLDNASGLTALVGSRIYKGELPADAAFPAVCFNRISTLSTRAFHKATGDIRARVQIDISAKRDNAADAVAAKEQVKIALQDYSGGGIKDIAIDDERHGYSFDDRLHVLTLDVIIWFQEG